MKLNLNSLKNGSVECQPVLPCLPAKLPRPGSQSYYAEASFRNTIVAEIKEDLAMDARIEDSVLLLEISLKNVIGYFVCGPWNVYIRHLSHKSTGQLENKCSQLNDHQESFYLQSITV